LPEQINNFIHDGLPIIAMLSTVIFTTILVTRLLLRVLLYFAVKNYQVLKKVAKRKKKVIPKDSLPKEDEARFIQKEGMSPPKADSYQIMANKQQDVDFEKPQIVDIVKPVGFWTSMVLGQKLTYLVSSAKLMNDNKKGFWTSMVEAQARAAGRERGKGR
jgi:hypothetical protein